MKFCKYVCLNFETIKLFVERIIEEDCATIGHLLSWMNENEIEKDLLEILELQVLPDTIAKLESRNLTIYEQQDMINQTMMSLPDRFKNKLDQSLRKNPSYHEIFAQKDRLSKMKYKFAPLTSVEVERSFSQVKNILTSQRTRLTETSFKQLAVLYYNSDKDE